jgi:hypothetical protein
MHRSEVRSTEELFFWLLGLVGGCSLLIDSCSKQHTTTLCRAAKADATSFRPAIAARI